jgi:sugar (pentulose or hexulose) kinase
MTYILSVDAGTTATKVALFDVDGKLLASSTKEYELITPSPLEVEVDAETLWNAFRTGVREALKCGIAPVDIKAIGISAQGETLIPVDKAAKPLRRAIVWLDNRAQAEADILDREFDHGSSYQITGQVKIVPTWPASKILWLRNHEPKTFAKVSKYLLVEDYLIYRMTGKFVAEGSLLCSTAYWNIRARKWWDEMLEFIGITADHLPEIRESAEPVGTLLTEPAQALGLASTTLVSTGALDQAAGAIGVGNIRQGLFSENTGAALAICAPLDELKMDPRAQMPIHYFAKPGTYMIHTFTTGGMVLRWFRDKFCQPEIQVGASLGLDPYDLLGTEAARIAPGSEGLVMLPHLQGAMAPESNPSAKGVFYGFTLRHNKAHFARAIMEAIACIVRRNIDAVQRMSIRVDSIRALGGGAKSRVWKQIEADLTKKTVVTTSVDAEACLGAAILAGKAARLFKSVDDACSKMVRMKEQFTPDSENSRVYDELYKKYIQLYDDLCAIFEQERLSDR